MTAITGPGQRTGSKIPSGYKYGQIDRYTPEQWQVFGQMQESLGPQGFLSKLAGGDEKFFDQLEKPALKQFQGVLGGIASKFSGQGMGARKSSGFGLQTTNAASDFAQQLQANRIGLQRQAYMDLLGAQQGFLGLTPYEQFLVKKKNQGGNWGDALTGAASGASAGASIGSLIPGLGTAAGAIGGGLLGGVGGFFS